MFYFQRCWKFCLAHGLRRPPRGVKSDVRTLNFRSDVTYAPPRKTPNDVGNRSLCDVKYPTIKEMTFFNVIGKKNNQTSISDADREIPTLGLKDNAGNEVQHYPLTLGLGFLDLHR